MSRKRNKQSVPTQPKKKSSFRTDGFSNSVIGHGTKHDQYSNFAFAIQPKMSDQTMINMYESLALCAKIIDLPANEAVKHGVTIEGDKQGFAKKMLDELDADCVLADALRWSRLLGGSAILLIAEDGGTLEDELSEETLLKIHQLRVYDKSQIFYDDILCYDDPSDCRYGKPMYYQINPIGGNPFYVHESRLLLFTGDPLPDIRRVANQGWGKRALDGMTDEIVNNQHSYQLAIKVFERMSQGVLMLSGMLDVLSEENGEDQIKKRLELIDMARSVLNTIAIDADDKYDIKSISMSAIPDLLDRFGYSLSATCSIPAVILYGHNPKGAGLAQSGGTDLENWYNFVSQIRNRQLRRPQTKLIRLLMLCKNGLFKGKELENWSLTFNPLWNPSETEQAQSKKDNSQANLYDAQAEVLRIQNKVLSVAECQRQQGLTADEITAIDKEKENEAEQLQADILGHSFGDVTAKSTATQPAKLSDTVK